MTGVAASCAYGAPAFETTPHRRSPARKQVPTRRDCRDFVPVWPPLVPGPHAQVAAAGDPWQPVRRSRRAVRWRAERGARAVR